MKTQNNVDAAKARRLITFLLSKFGPDAYISKIRHLRYSPDGMIGSRESLYKISNFGGLTDITVSFGGSQEVTGRAVCSRNDNFCKPYGIYMALRKALNEKNRDFGVFDPNFRMRPQ